MSGLPPKWSPQGIAVRLRGAIREPGDVVLALRIGVFLWRTPATLGRSDVRSYLAQLRAARPRLRGSDLDAQYARIERLRELWLRRSSLRRRDSCYLRSLTLYRFVDPGERPMKLHFGIEDQRDADRRLRAHVWVSIGDRTYERPPIEPRRLREMPLEAWT